MSSSIRTLCLGWLACAVLQAASFPTATTLDFSANPVAKGQREVLTATVQADGPVTPGLVMFTDGRTLLGTAQVSSGGTALLPVRLGPGVHSITAKFLGTESCGSSSSPAQDLTVSGAPPTMSLTVSGTPGNYRLMGTVTVDTPSVPTGAVQFVDRTNANLSLGTVSLDPPKRTQTFNYDYYRTETSPQGGTVCDLNGDGVPDLAFADGQHGLTVLLGTEEGILQYPVNVPTETSSFNTATGDFNSDGIPDLAVVGNFPNGIDILLGRGDGTFQPFAPTSSGWIAALSVAVGDFNGDGIPDLAAGDVGSRDLGSLNAQPGQGTLAVLLGKGDGTFGKPRTLNIHLPAGAIVTADFNADGKTDLAVVDLTLGTVTILLGAGNGTFEPGQSYGQSEFGYGSRSLITADFNNDGKADLAVANSNDQGTIGVLLGRGDGAFSPMVTYPAGSYTYGVAAADMNDDGFIDLVASNALDNTLSVLPGRGDGAFSPQTTYQVGSDPHFVFLSDWNNDGIPDAGVLLADGEFGVLQGAWQVTATANLDNTAIFGSGLHEVVASYQEDNIYPASSSSPFVLPTTPIRTTLVLSAYPITVVQGQPVQLTAVLSPFMAYNYTAGGTVTFSTQKKTLGASPIVDGAAILSTSDLPAGINVIIARYSGDANFSVSRSEAIDLKVNAAPSAGSLPVGRSVQGESTPSGQK